MVLCIWPSTNAQVTMFTVGIYVPYSGVFGNLKGGTFQVYTFKCSNSSVYFSH